MTSCHNLRTPENGPIASCLELTRFDRILLHLRCLYRDHKYRWHLAGVWRELRPQ
jgi:hypothetical protein